jgi:nicotinate-nucleotide--dimethylbenzimidazole phosphoribosyltransferase
MSTLQDWISAIEPVSDAIGASVQAALDAKTKPRHSLGRLEALARRYAAARGTIAPEMPRKAVVVMAADHGVTAEGVSAYPSEVTAQMVLNFAAGGAAINVLCRRADAELVVVDMGVAVAVDAARVRSARIAAGTANFARGPAMSESDALRALQYGVALAGELVDQGITVIGLGEMGIGNTTSASALVAALSGRSAAEVTGRGTGVDDATLARKIAVVEGALRLHQLGADRPLRALACVGGFEIAGLCGLILGAAARRIPLVVDGFITASAALVAARLAPAVSGYLIASHLSVEPGHRHALDALGLTPLLALEMRLGEGSGAALALGLLDAAIAILREMATFESANVADSGA